MYACEDGAACSNGTCVKGTGYSQVTCNSDSDCGDNTDGVCGECNGIIGERVCGAAPTLSDCAPEWSKALECYESHGCAPVPGTKMTTCAQMDCTADTNTLLSCKTNCYAFRQEFSNCVASSILRNCPKFAMWERIVIAFSVLVVVVIILFVIYAVSRVMTRKYMKLDTK